MEKNEVIDLIKDAGFGFLATAEGNQPRVRPMAPFLTDEGKILIALLPNARTINQIEKNPQVEICFVDRKMWYCRITGNATLTDDIEKKTALWNNMPSMKQYFGSPEDPTFNLMEVEIVDVEAMTPHQKEPEKVSIS